jgi:diacylglycerol kinase family enzyme
VVGTVAGIGLVFNPRAGRNKRDPDAPRRLARQLGDHGVVAAPRSVDELVRVAEDFRRQRIEVLGIAGGDGTNHVTLTGFHEVYADEPLPTVALLRGGTMNTVANSLGLPRGRTHALLDRLVVRYLHSRELPAVEQWTLDVEGKLGFLWGLGAVPAFLHEYYATGAPSPWTAVKTLARGIGSAVISGSMVQRVTEPVVADVTMDTGEHWELQPYLSIAAGTIRDIGLGFKPFHRAGEIRGSFHLLGIHTSPLGFVLDLPRIHDARGMSTGKSTDSLVRRATIRTRKERLRYMIDGDVREHPTNEMTIRIGPIVRFATMN